MLHIQRASQQLQLPPGFLTRRARTHAQMNAQQNTWCPVITLGGGIIYLLYVPPDGVRITSVTALFRMFQQANLSTDTPEGVERLPDGQTVQ